jgi:hypothetical protein
MDSYRYLNVTRRQMKRSMNKVTVDMTMRFCSYRWKLDERQSVNTWCFNTCIWTRTSIQEHILFIVENDRCWIVFNIDQSMLYLNCKNDMGLVTYASSIVTMDEIEWTWDVNSQLNRNRKFCLECWSMRSSRCVKSNWNRNDATEWTC